MFIHLECETNSDCQNGETCDPLTNTCKRTCREKKDCPGDKQTCDTSTSICRGGELISLTTIVGSCLIFQNAKLILTAVMVKLVTLRLTHAKELEEVSLFH